MEQSQQTCFHVILCEMNYVLDILHYSVINHNKILTREPILMQIRSVEPLQTLTKSSTNTTNETELVLILIRAKELADRPLSFFVPKKKMLIVTWVNSKCSTTLAEHERGENENCIHNRSTQVNLDKIDTINSISKPYYYLTPHKCTHFLFNSFASTSSESSSL